MKQINADKALALLRALEALDSQYRAQTGRDALSDLLVLRELDGLAADELIVDAELAMALMYGADERPSAFGDGRWAETTWDAFSDEVHDALERVGMKPQ